MCLLYAYQVIFLVAIPLCSRRVFVEEPRHEATQRARLVGEHSAERNGLLEGIRVHH